MTAGHVLLKILAGFTIFIFSNLFGTMLGTGFFYTFSEGVTQHLQFSLAEHATLSYSLIKTDLFIVFCEQNLCELFLSIGNLLDTDLTQQKNVILDYSSLTVAQCVSYLILIEDQKIFANYSTWLVPAKMVGFNYFFCDCPKIYLLFIQFDFFVYLLQSILNLLFTISFFGLLAAVLILFVSLELFVAILQAYVFSILLVIYLRDMFELH